MTEQNKVDIITSNQNAETHNCLKKPAHGNTEKVTCQYNTKLM